MNPDEFDSEAPLLEGLGDLPAEAFDMPAADPAWKADLLVRTSALVRGRRRRRRAAAFAFAIVTYAAGIVSALVWFGEGQPAVPGEDRGMVATEPVATPLDEATPEEIERRAGPARLAERIDLLRLAGDRYLSDLGDVEGALRCYRAYLELASGEETMEPESDDSWLLINMKQSRRQGGV